MLMWSGRPRPLPLGLLQQIHERRPKHLGGRHEREGHDFELCRQEPPNPPASAVEGFVEERRFSAA
jgi:hypothetical protein